ncbi:MAG: hypothetical protein CM1200mP39_25320 [Dehalococcoidia bacterium]|nr:MAG: hypothetical protein CM1200mP39_25320 [Dehalococcoidia bacterium]
MNYVEGVTDTSVAELFAPTRAMVQFRLNETPNFLGDKSPGLLVENMWVLRLLHCSGRRILVSR